MAWRLNHSVILQIPTTRAGRAGSRGTTTYTDLPTRAALMQSTGNEAVEYGTRGAEHRRTFVVRYHPELNEKWCLVFEGFAHDIRAVDPIPGSGRNRYLRLTCEVKETTKTDVSTIDTGPQPLYATTSTDMIGAVDRQNFNVQTYGSNVVGPPEEGMELRVNISVTDATPSGKYIVFLFPQDWGDPTGFYYRGDTIFNQVGAFRFVPANLLGSTSEFSHRYRAMVSNNRKLTDTPVTGTIVWDRR